MPLKYRFVTDEEKLESTRLFIENGLKIAKRISSSVVDILKDYRDTSWFRKWKHTITIKSRIGHIGIASGCSNQEYWSFGVWELGEYSQHTDSIGIKIVLNYSVNYMFFTIWTSGGSLREENKERMKELLEELLNDE